MDNIKRRSFLKSLGLGAAALAVLPIDKVAAESIKHVGNGVRKITGHKIKEKGLIYNVPKGATSLRVTCVGGGGGGSGSSEFTMVNSYHDCSTVKVNEGDKIVISTGGSGGNG